MTDDYDVRTGLPHTCPNCGAGMVREGKLERELAAARATIERLRAWLMRTASDDHLKHRAGYHGRRVMLEAAAVLNGRTIPEPVQAGGGG